MIWCENAQYKEAKAVSFIPFIDELRQSVCFNVLYVCFKSLELQLNANANGKSMTGMKNMCTIWFGWIFSLHKIHYICH